MMHGTRGGGECVRLCRGIGHNLTAHTHTPAHTNAPSQHVNNHDTTTRATIQP